MYQSRSIQPQAAPQQQQQQQQQQQRPGEDDTDLLGRPRTMAATHHPHHPHHHHHHHHHHNHRASYSAHSPTQSHFSPNPLTPANAPYERASFDAHLAPQHRHPQHQLHHPPTPAALPIPSVSSATASVSLLRHVNSPPPPPPPPQSSGLSLPGSANGTPYLAREKPSSTFYDPTLDSGDASSSWQQHSHYTRQPTFVPPHPPHSVQRRESAPYLDTSGDLNSFDRSGPSHFTQHSSPYPSSHSQPPSRIGSISHTHPSFKPAGEPSIGYQGYGHSNREPPVAAVAKSPSLTSERSSVTKFSIPHSPAPENPSFSPSRKNDRKHNPMAFSSILLNSNSEPGAPVSSVRPQSPPPPPPAPVPVRISAPPRAPSPTLPASASVADSSLRRSSRPSVLHTSVPDEPPPMAAPRAHPRPPPAHQTRSMSERSSKSRAAAAETGLPSTAESRPTAKKKLLAAEKGNAAQAAAAAAASAAAAAVARMEDESQLSDLENAAFDAEKARFLDKAKKRSADIEDAEAKKRRCRRATYAEKREISLRRNVRAGEIRYQVKHGPEANAEIQQQEVADEKDRKRETQRKRRRETAAKRVIQKRDEAIERAANAADEAERQKYYKEAERVEKRARASKRVLEPDEADVEVPKTRDAGGVPAKTAAPAGDHEPEQPTTKKRAVTTSTAANATSGRSGNRPKKSKEQKQAEKDAAEAAHAAMEKNEPLAPAPVEGRRAAAKKDAIESKDAAPAPVEPYVSKGYNQLYDQIWRDIARKEIPRVLKLRESMLSTKQANLRKTAQLASKEARRWQVRTNKSMKDVQGRAKRSMREMMSFWKRNEREERDLRRIAEKQEIENAKRAEAAREANRQRRKLNFLISQTELYSHFVGRKIKTDEVERSTDSVDVDAAARAGASGPAPKANNDEAPAPTLPDSITAATGPKVTNFEDLDFDDEDESKLQAIAAANAQSALQEAQDRARAFDAEQTPATSSAKDLRGDDEELNFQNPSSLGGLIVPQPKMLTAQLKEYQLKGLNWLVNLYEQGINGILADEMGLGKTVQSISVMAYLAESHNIWGPFLVVAPASTLHNWQQEITRFVPDLKVLPYWGNAKDRKVLRKFWDRKHITYTRDSPFHVLVTSYQLVVQDAQYFQKIRWQYMILDEAQAIKSSQSSRWKSLLGFHCRNRLLLTGTPIQNNMQELWALLHFIMPSLFDSHDEFSDWFSKDIESHAQSNTKLNEDQLKRLHMILKPFMLRRVKKHVQKELGDKIEEDVYCDLTYRQRAYYTNLRNRISIMDLIEKAAVGDDQDAATLMNLVMQFRKVCNHPDLFERAETTSPLSSAHFAETASFLREGPFVHVGYSTRNLVEYRVPRLLYRQDGRVDLPDRDNPRAGFRSKWLGNLMNIWTPENIKAHEEENQAFSWLRFVPASAGEVSAAFRSDLFSRALDIARRGQRSVSRLNVIYDGEDGGGTFAPASAMLSITEREHRTAVSDATNEGYMRALLTVSSSAYAQSGLRGIEQCARPAASAPPVELVCSSRGAEIEKRRLLFNVAIRRALYRLSEAEERRLVEARVHPAKYPLHGLLPRPISDKARYTNIQVPSMRRFVTDSGKLARLDRLLRQLKEGGHRVLLYFQMTRMIDLMEEYLTYRNYKYLRLDGSTKLEDRRDTVHDFQTRPDVFVFLLSTRAGGLGINLTAADTVIFYDSDWNPTIDSQAMDRAHRLGQTRQVTVYRMITRGTIEERIRKRALQKEEVQRVVISGGAGAGVDFNTRSRENRTKDIAMWLADDDQAAEIERKEAELAAAEASQPVGGKRKAGSKKRKADVSLDEMYHEGEGHFDDGSNKPSGTATPVPAAADAAAGGARAKKGGGGTSAPKKPAGRSKRARTTKERLEIADGGGE